jgi:hypothetical protein
VKGLSASKVWANASQAVWRLAVGDLDIETGKVCDRLHSFAFVLIRSMLEPRQRESPSTASCNIARSAAETSSSGWRGLV